LRANNAHIIFISFRALLNGIEDPIVEDVDAGESSNVDGLL